ncbi:MAG: DNA repair protein RecO [Calditrichaeota bacterium]|nr:MAG: DNA repair protein RecO [Calditrichota bacterium]MBL1205344.1 DNA repair protein RecO [Calditrichota bacterium]NOG45173.1 DNA repair protein RecO [Calditrichota bacterium]
MSNTVKTKALVLSSIRWKESSKIVTLYSAQLGKIKVIARGAYKNNSAFAGKLESLQLSEFIILSKESRSLQILKEVEHFNSFNTIRMELNRLPYGLAILELINQVLEDGSPDEVFFDFIVEMLHALENTKSPANVLIYFLLKLSSYMGFKPSLQDCSAGDLSKCADKVFLSLGNGKIFCRNCPTSYPNPIQLQKEQFFFLKNLQNLNHRRLGKWEFTRFDTMILIQRLISYINFHFEKNIHIEALQLLS